MIRTELISTVPEMLLRQAKARPSRIAFIDDLRTITYGELAETTARLACHLQSLGARPGDAVLMYLDNCVEVAESYLGVPRADLVAVCVNPSSAVPEVRHVLSDCEARLIITDEKHLTQTRQIINGNDNVLAVIVIGDPNDLGSGPVPEINYSSLLSKTTGSPRDGLGLDDTSWMLYTSGTTGRPKGVHLTQRGCFWVVAACWAPIIGMGPADVLLSPLPLSHSYALDLCVLAVVAVGASARILERFWTRDIARRLTGGIEGDVTLMPGVPTMFSDLLERYGEVGLKIPTLRHFISAGAIMPAALNEEFESAFGRPLLDGYGITETSTMVTMNWPTGGRPMGSCGLSIPGLAVRLVDPKTKQDVMPGVEGEIWVQGPSVTPGYHNLPDATAAAIVNGWYRTGDLAKRDENGFLRISGREKDLIIRGGENIYPAEVEEALLADSSILDAAVVSEPHDRLGEVPVAFVVPRDPGQLDHAVVLERLRSRLSLFKVPTQLIETTAIPRTGSGKIIRFRLQQIFRSKG